MKKFSLAFILLLCSVAAQAQKGIVKGKLINAGNGTPAGDVQVTIIDLKMLTTSIGNGDYSFSGVPYGQHTMVIGGITVVPDTVKILVNEPTVDLGDHSVSFNEVSPVAQQQEQIPTIALEDNNEKSEDDGTGGQSVSGLLTASRDPFLNTVAFVFGPYRFQARGYDRNAQEVQINGTPMNDIETGDAFWSQWGGLNDVFRGRSQTYGLQFSENSFGGVNGSVYFDATAANQRKQTRVTYSSSNRSYRNRLVFTKSTGMMKNGWAFSLSASKRWANEGYIPGTFYDGYSYYIGASKKFGSKHTLNFIAFGAPTRRGKSSPSTKEAYDITGDNYYNPAWGYQNGVKRNARVGESHQPIGILSYEYTPSDKTNWTTAVSYQFGKNASSYLVGYNGSSPVPTYYRYMPSYYELNGLDPSTAEFYQHQQLDWDRMYNSNLTNNETIYNVDGVAGSNFSGRRSIYTVASDVDDIKKGTINSTLQQVLSTHVNLYSGFTFADQRTETYLRMDDLLGGDYFINLNQFAAQTNVGSVDISQNDLEHPNRLIKEGDKFSYDYISHFQKGWDWLQFTFTYNKVDFFVAGMAGFNTFNREGLYRNGLFADNSLGLSSRQTFVIYGAKGGATYKINGRHYLFVNASVSADAPSFDNTFVSPRTRNTTVDNPQVQTTRSVEGGYMLHSPRLSARVVGYATEVSDATEIKRFYNDDPAFQTFVNYALQHVKMQFIGTELAVQGQINSSLSATAVAALGQAFYSDNPTVSVYRDNDTTALVTPREVYIKNYYVAAGPQTAISLGLNYRSKKFWYASINANYFDRNYMDVSADRRTVEATDLITPNSALWHEILDQQKLPSAFTVDVFGGKSFLLSKYFKRLPRNTFLYLNVGISNLLDNKDIITGAFEQLRYDFTDNNPGKFPPKYFYGLGRNYFVNISFKF